MAANKHTSVNAIAEAESPVLYRDWHWYSFCRKCKYGAIEWSCIDRLSNLFEIDDDVDEICFVAKARADRSTYKIKLDDKFEYLIEPAPSVLYVSLARWLKKQIAAGRPHIGVRIIK